MSLDWHGGGIDINNSKLTLNNIQASECPVHCIMSLICLFRPTDASQDGIDLTTMTVHDGHELTLEMFECAAYNETVNVGVEPLYEIMDQDLLDPSQADGNTSHDVPIADDDGDHGHKPTSQDNTCDLKYIECVDDTGQYENIGGN